MKYVKIKIAANGYIASEDLSFEKPTEYFLGSPFVFESFNNLIAWLRENLEHPNQQVETMNEKIERLCPEQY